MSVKIRLLSLLFAVATLMAVAKPVVWTFPREGGCQEGMAFSDGVTGILVWGGGDTLRITVGRGDLWDHRGGYSWTEQQSYTNIVDAVRRRDEQYLFDLFKKIGPPNEVVNGAPVNPMLMPLGRVVVMMPCTRLVRGELDPMTGLGTLELMRGEKRLTVNLAMSNVRRQFVLRLPEDVKCSVRTVAAYHAPIAAGKSGSSFTPASQEMMPKLSYPKPTDWTEDGKVGFTQPFPEDESVSLGFCLRGHELAIATTRGDARPSLDCRYADAEADSRAYWGAFWRDCARIRVPDPVIQQMFDYGMYRFAAMTDPDGVPAGLQGPWLEDDQLIPWNGDYHFNINVQECYSPAFRSGHVERLRPLFKMIRSWWPQLRENARKFVGIDDGFVLPHSVDDRGVCIGGFWTGTIDHASTAWMADLMFRYVRYSRDMSFLRTDAYPFMRGAMKVYRKMLVERNGQLSLPVGPSPEWGDDSLAAGAVGDNPSFQLAHVHRLARNLVKAAEMLGEKPDAMWLDVMKRLPLCSELDGKIAVYSNQLLTRTHRHHSHLAGFYPCDVFDLNDDKTLTLAQMSYRDWVLLGCGEWTGWSMPWGSILHTHFGSASAAVWLLNAWNEFFTNPGHGSHHDMYRPGFSVMRRGRNWRSFCEGDAVGEAIMQMDGMCACVTAIMELFAHEINGKTEFFRGCPEKWADVSFENMLLSDGTRVSGRRTNGKIRVVRHGLEGKERASEF